MANTTDQTTAHLNFILSTLQNLETEPKFNWNQIATENGIGYGRNAASKFKDILKKYGYKFENGKVGKIDEDGGEGAVPKTPGDGSGKKVKRRKVNGSLNGKKGKNAKKNAVGGEYGDEVGVVKKEGKTSRGKKRKIEDVDEHEDEDVDVVEGNGLGGEEEEADDQDENDVDDGDEVVD